MESALRQGGTEPGLKLIETLRWDRGPVRCERHLARLARSAEALGWGCDVVAARRLLEVGRDGPARLRLTLDRDGAMEVVASAFAPVAGVWRIGLAGVKLASGDPWLTVKTTRRTVYDDARAALGGLDEALFVNELGEVCDGTITTVFFDRGQGMRTPPLSSGLLPGVLREEMLATGAVREEVLMEADLPHVRLWIGNSLRGLIPAVWAG